MCLGKGRQVISEVVFSLIISERLSSRLNFIYSLNIQKENDIIYFGTLSLVTLSEVERSSTSLGLTRLKCPQANLSLEAKSKA